MGSDRRVGVAERVAVASVVVGATRAMVILRRGARVEGVARLLDRRAFDLCRTRPSDHSEQTSSRIPQPDPANSKFRRTFCFLPRRCRAAVLQPFGGYAVT